ncbi:MAG: flagellar export chaperone FliS [Pseudomonadota bacterium]|jgi:flagellar protein FliS
MFAPVHAPLPPARSAPRASSFANAYRQVGVETGVAAASPHRLVAMLLDGLFDALQRARTAMAQGDVPARCREIGRAAAILDEGLLAGLDLAGPGAELARRLHDVYTCALMQLARANLRAEPEALDEVARMLEPVRDAWSRIAAEVAA